jgi:hypothetical protein
LLFRIFLVLVLVCGGCRRGIGGRRAEVERERFVVEVAEEDPEKLCHRNEEDDAPTEDADEEHERSDEEVEDGPVCESTESSGTECDRLLGIG